jgi:hypothetical protein
VRAPRRRDPYATEAVLPFGFDVDRHAVTRARDAEIARLDRQIAPPRSEADLLAEANAHPYAWELARGRMWRFFDYAALDRALEALRGANEPACRALHAVYVYAWMDERRASGRLLDLGLAFLDERLPDPLRAPDPPPPLRVRGPLQPGGGAGVDARELRNADMRKQAAAGRDPVEIAREFRVSLRTVYRVVNEAA